MARGRSTGAELEHQELRPKPELRAAEEAFAILAR